MNERIKPHLEDSIFLKIANFIPSKIKTTNKFGTETISEFVTLVDNLERDTFYFGFLDFNNRDELINFYKHNVGLIIVDKELFTLKKNLLVKTALLNNYQIKYGFPIELFDIFKEKNKICFLVSKVANGSLRNQSFKFEVKRDLIFNFKISERYNFDIIEEIIHATLPDSFERSFNGKNARNTTINYDSKENKFISSTVFYSHKSNRYLNIVLREEVESNQKLLIELNNILNEISQKIYPFFGNDNTGRVSYGKRMGLAVLGVYYDRSAYESLIA